MVTFWNLYKHRDMIINREHHGAQEEQLKLFLRVFKQLCMKLNSLWEFTIVTQNIQCFKFNVTIHSFIANIFSKTWKFYSKLTIKGSVKNLLSERESTFLPFSLHNVAGLGWSSAGNMVVGVPTHTGKSEFVCRLFILLGSLYECTPCTKGDHLPLTVLKHEKKHTYIQSQTCKSSGL